MAQMKVGGREIEEGGKLPTSFNYTSRLETRLGWGFTWYSNEGGIQLFSLNKTADLSNCHRDYVFACLMVVNYLSSGHILLPNPRFTKRLTTFRFHCLTALKCRVQ